MKDSYSREINYMRISITDRCNLRCQYCMPEGIECCEMSEILTYEEIVMIVRQATKLGIKYIKITGGEPLVRLGCCDLIKMLKDIKGIEKVTLTTNGVLLKRYLKELIDAGVDGINISLDTLDPLLYKKITGKQMLADVIDGIKEASQLSIPVKINAVALDLNDQWIKLLDLAKLYPIDVRFIEVMPIGYGKNFKGLNPDEMLSRIKEMYPLIKEDHRIHGHGPAVYYQIPGFKGSIGFISAIHGKFCSTCNRIRLTSEGYLKTCLCYEDGCDLKSIVRNNKEELLNMIRKTIYQKPMAHCFEKVDLMTERKEMFKIGG